MVDVIPETGRPIGGDLSGAVVQSAVLVGRDAAVAALMLWNGTVVTGESKRAPGDPFNFEVAYDLALGRALLAAGTLLLASATAASDCPQKS